MIDDTTVTETPTVTEVTETPTVKTFTQEEVNAIVAKEKKRLEKTQLSKEEVEEFQEYKKNKASEQDKYLELEKKLNSTVNELKDAKINALLLQANANDTDYVKFKVNQIKNEDETFEEALERFKETNSQYFKTEKAGTPATNSTPIKEQVESSGIDDWMKNLRKERGM